MKTMRERDVISVSRCVHVLIIVIKIMTFISRQ